MEGFKVERIEGNDTAVVILGEEDVHSIDFHGMSVISITGFDWNEMLSPWYAEPVFKKGGAFGGHGDEMVEYIRNMDLSEYSHRIIAGYSLAGLFALYASTKLEMLEGCASVSGSLWFPDFTEYLKSHPTHAKHVYLSLGDREKIAKNPLMASVEEKTLEVKDMLSRYTDTVFEMNEGNHFNDSSGRLSKAFAWLSERV